MPRAFGNAIAEIVAAPGTGAFSLGTAATGCKLFSTATEADGTAITTGDTVKCAAFAIDANGNPSGGREIGVYTFTSGSPNTLTRTTIIESSNGGAAVDFNGNVRVELIGFVAADVAAPELAAFGGPALPAAPAEGQRLFSRRRAGRDAFATRAASGAVREFMPLLGSVTARYAVAVPSSAALFPVGITLTAVGTSTLRNNFVSNMFSMANRVGQVSAAAINSSAGFRFTNGAGTAWRGNAAGLGGFYFICRFGVAAANGDGRFFVGLAPASAIGNIDPSTLANSVGIGCDSGDTNLRPMSNGASLGPLLTSLGANFPGKTSNTDLYEFRMFAQPNGSAIGWSLERLNTGDFTEGSISSDLPSASTLLCFHLWINTGSTSATPAAVDFVNYYHDSPV